MEHGEKFNTYTHMAGAVLALIGAVALVVLGAFSGDVWKIVSFTIYGTTLVLLYSFYKLYHNAAQGRFKAFMQKVGHISIYLLIAGSYTPFTVSAPATPDLSPDSNFIKLATFKTRRSKHANGNGILGGSCRCGQA